MSPDNELDRPTHPLTSTESFAGAGGVPHFTAQAAGSDFFTRGGWHRGPVSLKQSEDRRRHLHRVRSRFVFDASARHDRLGTDRPLRVLAYSLVLSRRAAPDDDWDTLQAEAEQCGYAIGVRLHDVAVPTEQYVYQATSTASRGVYTPPWQRPGWMEVRRLIRGGFADGVIVLNRHAISSDDNEYHAVIRDLGERCAAFIHLVVPEVQAGPT
ncbi:hypothetical protein OIB37_11445 [Streptomyces sp. NBC_00820]|uniref:hypothetical protein n=1 Tax=Streptomyces sp. NBC_00820 TaxID=2975842 RepID=UPI002ED51026|nr:hypothetical protein OIB37_11445 [Streptomyces sp. NBC_00820]